MTRPETSWTVHAACRGLTHVMFPNPWDTVGVAAARRACAGCPVQIDCLVLARSRRERDGVWAGKLRERATNESRVA